MWHFQRSHRPFTHKHIELSYRQLTQRHSLLWRLRSWAQARSALPATSLVSPSLVTRLFLCISGTCYLCDPLAGYCGGVFWDQSKHCHRGWSPPDGSSGLSYLPPSPSRPEVLCSALAAFPSKPLETSRGATLPCPPLLCFHGLQCGRVSICVTVSQWVTNPVRSAA